MAGGILKNKLDDETKQNIKISDSTKEFREQVLKNTKLNALLKKDFDPNSLNDEEIQQFISNSKDLTAEEKEGLKWNKQNLNDNEVLQKQIIENLTQTIDEPKTPFQKATHPELNEYYQDDVEEDLDDFTLGEPEFKVDELDALEQNHQSKIIEDQSSSTESNSKPKRSFEELRKEHYHNEHVHISDDEEEINPDDNGADEGDNEDEDEQVSKPKKSFAELRKQHYAHEHPPLGQTFDDEEDEDDEDDEDDDDN